MSVKFKFFILFLFLSSATFAQFYKNNDWEKTPTFYEIDAEEEALASVAIKEKYMIQYYQPVMGNSYRLFETKHSIIRVNSEKGVNRHNRVYIPIRSVRKVIDIKARVLTQDGKIKVLNKKNIKEVKNVKDLGSFKIFAIEGVTKNSQLEFIYTLEKEITATGSIIVQKDYKVKEAEVILRKPASLTSKIKSYNDFPEFARNVFQGNKYAYTATAKNIPAMIDEGSATPEANRMKVSYVVRGSFGSGMWQNLKNGIKRTYIDIEPRRMKNLLADFSAYNDKNKTENSEPINDIANYVHNTYNIIRSRAPEYDDINTIISKKQATEQGIAKVFTALLNHYDIDYEVVLTSNRFRHKFDETFYTNFNLQELLLYFPASDKYINPSSVNSRLDYAPDKYISNVGVFITNNDYQFKTIGTPDAEHTKTVRTYNLSINEDMVGLVECKQELTGYKADVVRGAHKYFLKEDYNKFKEIFATSGIEDAEISQFDVENERLDLITENVPFVNDWTYTAESLVDELGDDLMFNIGKVIGTQMEFYQEVERVNPVEIQFPNLYDYHFEIDIPEGFQPSGLEAFKIDEKVMIEGEEACSFISNYEVQDDKIIIKASETYNLLKMDIEHYEAYKKVVNSAFDFSKKGILFEKLDTSR
ncbi:DUF3857 domain-containing protein [Maribacter algarum]|uniref:DUF3857 domain-containing protein n=1 Tax=Maribacter algarum (ex Zhang et al. 2020) TaxID=2578118 RepID=A0A5S3QGH4_9FLAO|nr:DUF3857 domain-containing protein [Maribacter algarum]TMM56635.1 DUF3857 domain-containing protein [Maribacter algarum]